MPARWPRCGSPTNAPSATSRRCAPASTRFGRPRPQGRRRVVAEKPLRRRAFRLGGEPCQGAARLRGGHRGGAGSRGRRRRGRELRRRPLGRRGVEGLRRWPRGDRARRLARRGGAVRPPPEGALWATIWWTPSRLRGALTAMSGVAVVRDLSAALDLVATRPAASRYRRRRPGRRRLGQRRIGPQTEHPGDHLRGGEGPRRAGRGGEAGGELSAALAGALAEQKSRQDAAEQALAALNESDAAISAIYEQLGRLGQDARTADDEWQRLIRQRDELEAVGCRPSRKLAELEQRLHNAEQAPLFDSAPADRQQTVAAAETARAAEVEARLAVRTAEERANAVRGRADSLRRAAAAEREARLRAQRGASAHTPRRLRRRSPSPVAASRSG